ncbi:MAG: VTT domain-containing protein, partial [Candidatus Eiseniibacteriota bacterium]
MTDHDLERQTAATASRKPVRSRSPLAALESRAVRAVLYAVIVGVLVAAYWFQVLPHRADVLLDYFLLMSVATTISPLPVAPSIIYAATQAPDGATGIWLVALVGAVGTTIAYLLEYAILSRVFSLRGTRRIKRSRVYLWLVDLFQRAPFVALTVAAFLPLPVDGVRLLAISIHYHRRRFALAAFVGRMPRYLLIAVLGRSVDWQTLLASARRLLAGEAVGGGAGDAVWLVALAGLVALVGLGIAIRFGLRGWLRRRRGGDRVAAVLFLGLVGSALLATPLA